MISLACFIFIVIIADFRVYLLWFQSQDRIGLAEHNAVRAHTKLPPPASLRPAVVVLGSNSDSDVSEVESGLHQKRPRVSETVICDSQAAAKGTATVIDSDFKPAHVHSLLSCPPVIVIQQPANTFFLCFQSLTTATLTCRCHACRNSCSCIITAWLLVCCLQFCNTDSY